MRPIFIENSKVPVVLSKVSPIDIWAINLVFFVFCRGELTEGTKRHETIHFKQWLELGIIGFAILYPLFWVINLIRGKSGSQAYYEIPFEIEAYQHDDDPNYLNTRKFWAWKSYVF